MGMQIATLGWILLIISIVITSFSVIVTFSYAMDAMNEYIFKYIAYSVGLLFLTAILGWAIWVIYPITASGMS